MDLCASRGHEIRFVCCCGHANVASLRFTLAQALSARLTKLGRQRRSVPWPGVSVVRPAEPFRAAVRAVAIDALADWRCVSDAA